MHGKEYDLLMLPVLRNGYELEEQLKEPLEK